MFFKKKKKEKKDNDLVLVASVMPAFAGMYKDLLTQNNIAFFSRLQRSGEYLKFVTGALLIPEDFYVNRKDYDEALEIYNSFIVPTDLSEEEDI